LPTICCKDTHDPMSAWQEEDDLDESENPDESDEDSDEDPSGTAPCPCCGEDVYEEAVRCPNCGEYITPGAGSSSQPKWLIIGAALALLAVLLWLVF
jgi:hypothetical protein